MTEDREPRNRHVINIVLILLILFIAFMWCSCSKKVAVQSSEMLKPIELKYNPELKTGDVILQTPKAVYYYINDTTVIEKIKYVQVPVRIKDKSKTVVNINSNNVDKSKDKSKEVTKDKSKIKTSDVTKQKDKSGFKIPWYVWVIAAIVGVGLIHLPFFPCLKSIFKQFL